MKQLSKEWFEARKNRITGSNAGAALGVNPWKTPEDLIRQMVRDYHGAESEFTGNIATEWGNDHEPLVAMEYMGKTGRMVEECGFFVHPEHEWLGASPDGLIEGGGLIEIKSPFGQRNTNPPVFKTAKELPHYYAQMQVQMICADRSWTDFFQWAPHGDALERVEIDEEWIDENLPKLKEFYARYLSEIDNPEHLEEKEKEINTFLSEYLINEYDKNKAVIDDASSRNKEIIKELVSIAKERNAIISGRKLTKVERKGSISYAKVVKDHCPNVDLSAYTGKPSKYWRLN